MKKVLVLVAAAAGAVYARHRIEQQRSEKDLHAATSRMGNAPKSSSATGAAWAAASDRPT
ncbi:DLW-39 family protein [Janibacter terrae]|uniref:DLW-39 family protein n=1 Tax=Janibacter terrae TaxID=103817 RepID=UPI000832ED12|nr:DLW-39 family protein [Janibacter terrae]